MKTLRIALLLAVIMVSFATSRAKAQFWLIDVDTAVLAGATGNIDVQFNPGGADALPANASVHATQGDGLFGAFSDNIGGASGRFGQFATVSIDNSGPLNDHFQNMTFNTSFQLCVQITGPALDPDLPFPLSGSTFALSLYDDAGINPLLTTSSDGSLLHLEVNPDGSITPITFADASGITHAIITPSDFCPVPELGSNVSLAGLLVIGGVAAAMRKRRMMVR